jgi:hypothetical protein
MPAGDDGAERDGVVEDDDACVERVVELAVLRRARGVVCDEEVGPLEAGGIELLLLGKVGAHRGHVRPRRDPGGGEERCPRRRGRHDDVGAADRPLEVVGNHHLEIVALGSFARVCLGGLTPARHHEHALGCPDA